MDSLAFKSELRRGYDDVLAFRQYIDALWYDFSEWISTIHTDVPVLILTTFLVILTIALLYLTWRLWGAEKRKLPSPMSLHVWKVREFDAGKIVGAYRAHETTEYLPVPRDDDIAQALEERSDLLISGRPGIGKSHAAIHALQKIYPKWFLLYPPKSVVRHANQIHLKKRRYILLLDDLDEFTRAEDKTTGEGVLELIARLRGQAKDLIVVATIRSTLREAGAITDYLKSLAKWAQVELPDWSEEQGSQLARLSGADMRSWDHTPLSVKRPSRELIEAYRRCSVDAQTVVRALRVCRYCGLSPVRRDVLRAIYISELLAGRSDKFDSSLSEISDIGFLKEAGSYIAAYDVYLDHQSEWQVGVSEVAGVVDVLTVNARSEELATVAEHLADVGRLDFAALVFQSALEIAPQDQNIHYGLGIVLGKQGSWEAAEGHFARATKLVPGWVSPWLRLSVALHKQGKDYEATNAMTRARALDNRRDSVLKQIAIGQIFEEDGRVDEAVKIYRTILEEHPESSRAWWRLGRSLNRAARFSDAKVAHEAAAKLSPYWAAPFFGLAESLQELNDLDGAEQAVRRALDLSPGLYDAHVTLAHILTAKKRLGDAETQLKNSLARFPDAARLHSYLGSILNRRRSSEKAEEEFKIAIRLEADYTEAFVGLAMALRVQGKLDKAVKANEAAISIDPTCAEAHFGLAMCRYNTGNLSEAAARFRAAIEYRRSFPEAHYYLGKVLAKQRALPEAVEELNLAETQGFSPAKVSYEKAKVLCRLKYYPDALASLKKAKHHGFRFTEAISRNPVFGSLVPLPDFRALYEESPIGPSTP